MSISLEALWKSSSDQELLDAVGKWQSINDDTRRVVAAEAKRRGLPVSLPEVPATASSAAGATGPRVWTPMTFIVMAVIVALVIALAKLV
jgi:hypothetical protein